MSYQTLPERIHPERITKADNKMVNDLDYADIKLSASKKDHSRTEPKNNICVNVFCYENDLVYPVYYQMKNLYGFINDNK